MQYEVRYRAGRAIGSLTIQSDSGSCSVILASACGLAPGFCTETKTISGTVESVAIGNATIDVDDSAIVQLDTDFSVSVATYSTYVEVFEYEEDE